MLITVIICSYNRRDSLARTLDTLAEQVCERPFSVLVVDNNSKDGTAEMVEARRECFPVPLKVLSESKQGLSHARNLGLDSAEGSVLVFIDDDVDCPTDFVAAWARCFEDSRVDAAGGRILPDLPHETPDWMRERIECRNGGPTSRYDFGDTAADITPEGPYLLPFGTNMAMRQTIARDAGGFRVDLGRGSAGARLVSGEETEFLARLRQNGCRIVYCPNASVIHRIPTERITMDYTERWYNGYGRASVIHSNPRGWNRVWICVNAIVDLLRSAWRRAWTRSPSKRLEALQRRAEARGRIAEIMGR